VPRSYHEFAPAGKYFQRESAQIAAKPFFLMFRSSVLFRLFLTVDEKAVAMIPLTWQLLVLLELSWTTS
jgi:hypothetical protein